jgi:hypothetical protein
LLRLEGQDGPRRRQAGAKKEAMSIKRIQVALASRTIDGLTMRLDPSKHFPGTLDGFRSNPECETLATHPLRGAGVPLKKPSFH